MKLEHKPDCPVSNVKIGNVEWGHAYPKCKCDFGALTKERMAEMLRNGATHKDFTMENGVIKSKIADY